MNDSLTPLEERRLAELRHYVSARALDTRANPRRIPQPRRPLVPALTLTAVAATAVAVAVVMTSPSTTPKTTHQDTGRSSTELTGYTVKRAPDGVVTVTLTDYRHASQLSSQLQADGIPAMVVYTPPGEYCDEPDAAMVNGPRDYSMPGGVYSEPQFLPGGGWQMQINPSHIKPGESLLFGIIGDGKKALPAGSDTVIVPVSGSFTYLVTGKLTACQYHPSPNLRPSLRPGVNGHGFAFELVGVRFGRH